MIRTFRLPHRSSRHGAAGLVLVLFTSLGEAGNPPPPVPRTQPQVDPYFVEPESLVTRAGPHNITRNVLQTRDGMIWLATFQGLVRYDGKVFTNVTLEKALPHYRFFTLAEDRAGNLWAGTVGAGVFRYDVKGFTPFTTDDGLANNRMSWILEDKAGTMWFATDGGLSHYDGKSWTTFTIKDGLPHDSVNCLAEDETGHLWIATSDGLCRFDGTAFTPVLTPEGQPFSNVRAVLASRSGGIWIGGAQGLFRERENKLVLVASGFVGNLYEDRAGNLWVSAATGGGMGPARPSPLRTEYWGGMALYRYDGKSFTEVSPRNTADGPQIFGVTEDRAGGIWFGTSAGACRFDGQSVVCW